MKVIIYFDGVCNLCNRLVDFVIRRDRHRRFRFAPLQGPTARERLPASLAGGRPGGAAGRGDDFETLVVEEESGLKFRSAAVIAILTGLGGVWRLAGAFRLIPRGIRDRIYDYIARSRFRWFGRRDTCRVPTPAERELFLD